jgi:hypothetical protein
MPWRVSPIDRVGPAKPPPMMAMMGESSVMMDTYEKELEVDQEGATMSIYSARCSKMKDKLISSCRFGVALCCNGITYAGGLTLRWQATKDFSSSAMLDKHDRGKSARLRL